MSSMTFSISGQVGALVTVTELSGDLVFNIQLTSSTGTVGDLRALYFDIANEGLLSGLSVTGANVTSQAFGANAIRTLGSDTNMNGEVLNSLGAFDAGIQLGTSGIGRDDIRSTTFTLSHSTVDLTLDLIASQDFGVRITSVGLEGGPRNGSLKLGGEAPGIGNVAPLANDDAAGVLENNSLSGNVLANDTDGDGDTLAVTSVSGGTLGTPFSVVSAGGRTGQLVLGSNGAYTFNTLGGFDNLGVGQTDQLTVTYGISDGQGGTDTATLVITVTGTNDVPVISNATTFQDYFENGAPIQIAPSLTITDIDSPTLQGATVWFSSVLGFFPDEDRLGFVDQNGITATMVGNELRLTGTASVADYQAALRSITYYNVSEDPTVLPERPDGDRLISFTVYDGHGNSAPLPASFVFVRPVNDSPVLLVEAGDSDGQALAETNVGLTATGTLTAVDPDVSDLITASVIGVTHNGPVSGITDAQLLSFFSVTSGPIDTAATSSGQLTWTFNSGGLAFDYLADYPGRHETLTLSYTIRVDDGHGGTADRVVTIVIQGTNDGPVAYPFAQTVAEGDSIPLLTNLNVGDTDQDASLSLVETVVVSGTGTLAPTPGFFNQNTYTASGYEHLAEGETATAVIQYTVADQAGATATNLATVTIIGVNDAPTITAGTGNADPIPETNAGLTATGTVTVNDVDVIDIVTASVIGVATAGPTGGLSPTDLLSYFSLAPIGPGGVLPGAGTSAPLGWTFDSGSQAFNFLAVGEVLTLHYTIRPDDGHLQTGTGDGVVTIHITGTNDAPVITGGDVTGSVAEDGLSQVSGQLNAVDPDTGATLFWSVVGGTASANADYHFRMDSLRIDKNGGTFFVDTFSDGIAPPSSPSFVGGNAHTYGTNGDFDEAGGRVELDSENSNVVIGPGTPDPFVGNFATVRSNIDPANLALGLKSDDNFSVQGVFDLILPDSVRETYGIRLSDRLVGGNGTPPDQLGDDVIELVVRKAIDGSVRVALREFDFVADTVTNIQSVILSPPAGADQIQLRLTHSVTDVGALVGSFDYLSGGVVVGSHTFSQVGRIFGTETPGNTSDDENWTRAQFFAYAPERSDSELLGQYGTLTINQAGEWTYSLDNTRAVTQSLSQGEVVTDVFTVQVADEHGATDTETITVTVTGLNDAPIITSSTATSRSFNEDDPLTATGIVVFTDVDRIESHTVGATLLSSSVSGGGVLPPATAALLAGAISVTLIDTTESDLSGQYSWSFALDNAATQFLGLGQSLVLVYAVSVTDAHGASASQTVTITINGDANIIVGDANPNTLVGTPGNDEIYGLESSDNLQGMAGNDTLDGGLGRDRASFIDAVSGIAVDLAAGTVSGPGVGSDTLRSIELVRGSNFADTFVGTGYGATSANAPSDPSQGTFEGMGGNDTIVGSGNTQVSYQSATAGVTVDFALGTAVGDASVGTDTFTGVSAVRGTEFADTLRGNNSNSIVDTFIPMGGDDFIDGRGGNDRVSYDPFIDNTITSGVTINLAAGVVTGDASVGTDTLRSIEMVRGSSHADSFNATGFGSGSTNSGSSGAFNEFEGMAGNDTIVGNGSTQIAFNNATGAVTVDIAAGTAVGDASVGSDSFTGVRQVVGSSYNDSMFGSSASSEAFRGGAGNDLIDGRGGFDTAQYAFDSAVTSGIAIDMASGIVSGPSAVGTDTLGSIEAVQATDFADNYVATGFSGSSSNAGSSGTFNQFQGMGGNDTIIGNGNTQISFFNATAGVNADLSVGVVTGNSSVGTDTIFGGVNSVQGSNFADTITGGAGAENLIGNGGNDIIQGGGGNDTLLGGAGSDTFVFQFGDGIDIVSQFTVSGTEIDVIDLRGISGITSFADIVGDATHTAHATQVGADTVIDLGGGNTVRLTNVALGSLTADNFRFN